MTISAGTAAPGWSAIYVAEPNPATLWEGPGMPAAGTGAFPSPPAITIPHGQALNAIAAVLPDPLAFPGEVSFSGDLTKDSNRITNCSTTTGLSVGQTIGAPTASIQNGCTIAGVSGTTVTMSGSALLTAGGAGFTATEWTPTGTIAITVSPGTGVTLWDTNADGTPNVDHGGNATYVCNYSGQADGQIMILFASAGSFTVSGTFTSTDGLYSTASFPTLSVTVT